MDEPIDSSPFWTWGRLTQFAIFAQIVIVLILAIGFAVVTNHQNHVLADQTRAASARSLAQSQANHAVIVTLARDLALHAKGSASRSCASAKMISYLVKLTPGLKPHVLNRIDDFTKHACHLIAIPIPGSGSG